MDYVNHCPRWFPEGYSSDETFVYFKTNLEKNPPHVVADPE